MVTHREEGRVFHEEGPMVAEDLIWSIVVLTLTTREHAGPKSGEVDKELQKEGSVYDPLNHYNDKKQLQILQHYS